MWPSEGHCIRIDQQGHFSKPTVPMFPDSALGLCTAREKGAWGFIKRCIAKLHRCKPIWGHHIEDSLICTELFYEEFPRGLLSGPHTSAPVSILNLQRREKTPGRKFRENLVINTDVYETVEMVPALDLVWDTVRTLISREMPRDGWREVKD